MATIHIPDSLASAEHFILTKSKAFAAFVGALLTAILGTGIVIPGPVGKWAAFAAAILTFWGVYQAPKNLETEGADPNHIDGHSTVETPVQPGENSLATQ